MTTRLHLHLRLIALASFCLTLNACQSYRDQGQDTRAVCKELKYQMIMNTPTTSPSSPTSWKERANREKVSQNYHEAGCI